MELSAEEVGCQINLVTGRHMGECKGTCRESGDPILARLEALAGRIAAIEDTKYASIDTLFWKLDNAPGKRVEALEARVRELEEHRHQVGAKDATGLPWRYDGDKWRLVKENVVRE